MNLINVGKNVKKRIKKEGFKKTFRELFLYSHNNKELKNYRHYKEKIKKDVLFINGCDLSHPKRYRVDNQIEQFEYNGISCNQTYYLNIKIKQIYEYNTFILFRCPLTPLLERFINEAKRNNKKIIFDIDDLIFDTKYIKDLDISNKEEYEDGVKRINKTLLMCDAAIASTNILVRELKNYVDEVYLNRNIASKELIELSQKANLKEKQNSNQVTLGYFSGSITHNPDFEMILPVLIRIINEYDNVKLLLVGEINIPMSLNSYKDRITVQPFMDYRKLPELIKTVDINLIPLEKNLFNAAKSENKWLEASLVKVVSCASEVGSLKDMIIDNKTGLLCGNEQSWYKNLKKLIENNEFRQKIANNSYEFCLKNCTYLNLNTNISLNKVK